MKRVMHARFVIPIALVAVLVAGVGLYLFQPWRIFTNVDVDEALPTVTSSVTAPEPSTVDPTTLPEPSESPTPNVLAEGEFISHEYATAGSARILELPDGSRVLRIEGLDTSDGPDLKVWLTDQPVIDGVAGWGVFDDGLYVSLGELKGNRGNQNYPIPDDVDLSDYSSVSIWCERFAVSFGAAELST